MPASMRSRLTSGLSYQFSPAFGMFGFGRYERLVQRRRQIADHPRVRSRNQLSGGLGLSYTFTISR